MSDESRELDARVDALRRAGRYAEAANLCLQAGDPARASDLFAAVWDWPAAIRAAEQAGRYAHAYRHALEANDRGALTRLLGVLPDHPDQAVEAAGAAERKGRVVDAARLHAAAGDVATAAELYERAGELGEAARCHESAGRYREAGILYERRVREDPHDGEAALRLGRILAHFGRFEHAARALQIAERDPEQRRSALGILIACFAALEMHEAAVACLDRLRALDPALPRAVPDFLRVTYGDERGLAAYALEGGGVHDASQLLAGRYRVLRPLGSGATGRVVLTHDGFYDREVAVKILGVGTGSQGRDAYARFAREARVAAGIEHPNVVAVYEFNPDGPFLVMEYMAGGTLEERLEGDRPLPLAIARHVAKSLLAGLEAVHRRGVIHRDLKPANVFFGAAGDVKIGDFGVAHLQDLGATLTGALLGTLAYMAPEQITGSAQPHAATDLYAFGCILHRMLTGTLPYPGPDFVTQHLESPIPRVAARRPELGHFDPLVTRLLDKAIDARPGSVEEVRLALDALDWTDPDENALERLVKEEQRPPTPPRQSAAPSAPPPALERFTLLEPLEAGAWLAHDTLLERRVRVEGCDAARAAWLQHLGQADGPHLQAIFDVDVENERAVLEQPEGEPLSRALLDDARRERVQAELEAALRRLHAAGLVHGDLRLSNVIVGPGRAVLMLPTSATSSSPDDDPAALAALF
ncbi:MAG: protein kinase [Myxococcales bacterium]|nr:protein kinase [Myxococcales bacterium]